MNLSKTITVNKFNCLQADCPDTCCKGWSMQVDDRTFAKYKGTELENAIAYDGQDKEIRVMKRDSNTDYCVKFTDGICGIHAAKGADMLGDACYFYPRVTRHIGNQTIMTATLSCPEITRLALEDGGNNFVEDNSARLPSEMKDYGGKDLSPEQMLKIHESYLQATEADVTAERIMARIYSSIQSLKYIPANDWEGAAPFMIKMADGKLPAPESKDVDNYYLLQTFAAVFHATGKKMNERLRESIEHVENFLGIKLNWQTLNLEPHASQPVKAISDDKLNDILKRYLAAQISFSTFPFAGIAEEVSDKAKLLAFKFALTRLFLKSLPENGDVIKSIQSLARVIDHLASPQLIFNLMDQFGWNTEPRIRSLIGDQ